MSSISWLHLTDLHVGMASEDWLFPNFRQLLYDDLRQLHDLSGPWDLVLFSGDVVQTGSPSEYEKAGELIQDLWNQFGRLGSRPVLIAVPGNHDLVRLAASDPALRGLVHWHEDPVIRSAFWSTLDNPYLEIVNRSFQNFTDWYDRISVPKPTDASRGLLPGDSASILERDGFRLGVVALNSSFLQLTSDNYEARLDLDVRQLLSACGGDHIRWMEGLHAAILVTHHGRNWLHPRARAHFDAEVYPPNRFFAHFCGHLHEASTLNQSLGGASIRRTRQGPSLFGLRTWGTGEERIHGYSAGRLAVTTAEMTEMMWPRLAYPGYSGQLRLVADPGYELNQNNAVVWTYPRAMNADVELESQEAGTDTQSEVAEVSLIRSVSEPAARLALDRVPRTRLASEPQHRRVRRLEQATAERALESHRRVWINSDWGLATEEFIGTVIDSYSQRIGLAPSDVFVVRCDEASTIDGFRGEVHRQLGIALQQLLGLASNLPQCFLIVENVTPDLLTDTTSGAAGFDDLLRSMLEYCAGLRIILTTRSVVDSRYPTVQLRALDPPEVRTYVLHHPRGGESVADAETIDILYRKSAGLPTHLDRLLESLRYVNRHELADADIDPLSDAEPTEAVPRALERAVASLSRSPDRYARRSFKLLKVLTVLADGESLASLKHFDHAEPFFPANASQLESLGLVQVFSLADNDPGLATISIRALQAAPDKLLLVPRQVRDYVRPSIDSREYDDIVSRAAELVFGSEWRDGKLKHQYFKQASVGRRNERIILRHLVNEAIHSRNTIETDRSLRLVLSVCEGLKGRSRYRETIVIAADVLPLIETPDSLKARLELSGIYGEALRMVGRRDEAVQMIDRTLEEGDQILDNRTKASLSLDLALTFATRGESEMAMEAAKRVQELADKNSGMYLQAESIIASVTLSGVELRTELVRLERTARQQKHTVVANNIALDLAKTAEDDEANRLRDRVLASKEDEYNRVRAVVAKARSLQDAGRPDALSSKDRDLLERSYSFLHGQRMTGLFDSCHTVLWAILTAEGRVREMLRLFRHSSFVWRLYGKVQNEQRYVKDLLEIDVDTLKRSGPDTAADLAYFEGRKLESVDVT